MKVKYNTKLLYQIVQ